MSDLACWHFPEIVYRLFAGGTPITLALRIRRSFGATTKRQARIPHIQRWLLMLCYAIMQLVVVDNLKGCIGGLDICFGRWDTSSQCVKPLPWNLLNLILSLHSPLADAHPTQFYKTLFPGQDYNDARFADFEHVDDYASNKISVLEQPRMPWHDVRRHIILLNAP